MILTRVLVLLQALESEKDYTQFSVAWVLNLVWIAT